MTQIYINIIKIPVIVRIIGESIPVGDKIECRLKEHVYRNEVDVPQDISLTFDVVRTNSISSEISEFLHKRSRDFKNISTIIRKQEMRVEQNLIHKLLENKESETR